MTELNERNEYNTRMCCFVFLDLVVLGLKPLLTSQPYYKVERKTVETTTTRVS